MRSESLRRVGASLVGLALVAGCAGAKPTAAPTTAPTTAPTSAPTPAPTDTPAGLRVAIILPGSVQDQGYNADGKRAADMIADELGAETTITENVQIPNQTDVYRQYASQGYDLVVGWGGQFTDGAVTAAGEFAEVNFLVVNSTVTNGSNLGSVDEPIEQWQFVAGYVLAKLSTSGTVGWVGGLCFPSTSANQHGTEEGAKYANPDIDFLFTYTGDFEDATKAQQAAQAMIDEGADVLTQNLNNGTFGLIEASRANGNIPFITEWVDNHELAADVIASSVQKSQARFVTEIAKSVQDGTFAGEYIQQDLPADWGPVMSDTDLLPDDLYQEALDIQDQIVSGAITPAHDETCAGA